MEEKPVQRVRGSGPDDRWLRLGIGRPRGLPRTNPQTTPGPREHRKHPRGVRQFASKTALKEKPVVSVYEDPGPDDRWLAAGLGSLASGTATTRRRSPASEGTRPVVLEDLVDLRAVGAAHVPIALLARHQGIHVFPLAVRLGDIEAPDAQPAAEASVEPAIRPEPLLEHDHPSPRPAPLERRVHTAVEKPARPARQSTRWRRSQRSVGTPGAPRRGE